ncbi:MAG: outer membrane lipid asymmetry maintenance protein MlaD [Magnetospirillum gryphiswaldense]|nr:outer membrane lipid asymmetry maintenance protein MlaD [Magnetospirillum gryphiswaldense]
MGRNLIETIMGAVVLAVAGFFLAFAWRHAGMDEIKGYTVTAQFAGIGGLDDGADVRINGIKVGNVISQGLDPVTYNAKVKMVISNDIRLPADTEASIAAEGLLGGKYVKLIPGHAGERLADGAELTKTKDYKSIEEMVGQLIFLATADNPPAATGAPAPIPTEAPGQ